MMLGTAIYLQKCQRSAGQLRNTYPRCIQAEVTLSFGRTMRLSSLGAYGTPAPWHAVHGGTFANSIFVSMRDERCKIGMKTGEEQTMHCFLFTTGITYYMSATKLEPVIVMFSEAPRNGSPV